MPASKSTPVPRAAEPVYGQTFDPWNSSSSGHQRAENRLGASTGWRDSRNRKLMGQFTGGGGGGKRISDAVGEGARDWDPQAKALITPAMRSRARSSVLDMLTKPGTMRLSSPSPTPAPPPTLTSVSTIPPTTSSSQEAESITCLGPVETTTEENLIARHEKREGEGGGDDVAREQATQPRRIFDGVVVYLNGSTHPLISDHKLKHVLAEHGGSMSSHLGRRKVTHVILGRPAAGAYGSRGAGGGLAGGKLQREISKIGGPAVKYVGVQVSCSLFLTPISLPYPPSYPFPDVSLAHELLSLRFLSLAIS